MQDAQTLKHFFQTQEPIALVLGDTNINRSTLLSQAIDYTDPSYVLLRFKATTGMKFQSLLDVFTQHFTPLPTKTLITETLKEMVQLLQSQTKFCVLLIEYAHVLQDEMIAALCHLANLQKQQAPNLRIVLQGRAELAEKIARPFFIITPSPPEKKWSMNAISILSKHILPACLMMGVLGCGWLYWKIKTNDIVSHTRHASASRSIAQHLRARA